MKLKILLPFSVMLNETDVSQINIETSEGAFGLLEHRLDCVAALSPGILSYTGKQKAETFIAVDHGILVKTGNEVSVSVRNAVSSDSLDQLHDVVIKQFLTLDEQTTQVRSVIAKLESGFMHQFVDFHNET